MTGGPERSPLGAAEAAAADLLRRGLEDQLELEARAMVSAGAAQRHDRPRRVLFHWGQRLEVAVPRLRDGDGNLIYPPGYHALKERAQRPLDSVMAAGATSRRGARALRAAAAEGGTPRGGSKTRLQARRQSRDEDALTEVQTRWLGDKNIVAVEMDATRDKDTGKDHRRVVVIQGFTAEGRKLVLGVAAGATENAEVILPALNSLVQRGLDPRHLLWIVDKGGGNAKALRSIATQVAGRPVEADELWIQHCIVHQARNVYAKLRTDVLEVPKAERTAEWLAAEEALTASVRERMWDAWRSGDPVAGLAKLQALADELDGLGRPGAASSLRDGLENTFTVARLGLAGEPLIQLATTNSIESTNRRSHRDVVDVSRFPDDAAVLRWAAASLLRQERQEWGRLGDPAQLIAVAERIAPGRLDAGALLARVPPLLEVARFRAAADDEPAAALAAARSLTGPRRAVWIGSAATLRRYGARPGTEATSQQLTRALAGRHLTTADVVRPPRRSEVTRVGADGRKVTETVDAFEAMAWRLSASPSVARRWREARDEGERLEIGDALLAAAEGAIARVTRKEHRGGFAATATLSVVTDPATGAQRPQVEGFVVGVDRGRGPVLPPAEASYERRERRAAEDVAADVLGHRLGPGPRAPGRGSAASRQATARAAETAGERAQNGVGGQADYLARGRRLLGAARAKRIDRRAGDLAGLLRERGADEAWFRERWRELGDPLATLNAKGAMATLTVERDRQIALRRGARERARRLREEEARLWRDGVHLDGWLKATTPFGDGRQAMSNEERIARLTSLERVAAERGFALRPPAAHETRAEPERSPTSSREGPGAEMGL